MSQGRKYKGARKSRSFKPIGGGLRASEERIKEQARIIKGGLEFAMASQKAADKLKIEGFADKVAFEKGVQDKKNKLEEISRNRQLEAHDLRAKRDVERLRGIAEEYGKVAQHELSMIPKIASATTNLVTGFTKLADQIEYNQLQEHRRKTSSNIAQQELGQEATANRLKALLGDLNKQRELAVKQAKKDGVELTEAQLQKYNDVDPEEVWKIFGDHPDAYFRTNILQGKDLLTDFRENRSFYVNTQLPEMLNRVGAKVTETTADEWYTWAAYEHLKAWGISPSSKEGSKLVDSYQALGRQKSIAIRDKKRADRTESIRFRISKDLVNELSTSNEDKWVNLAFNSLVYTTRKGVYEDKNSGFTYGIEGDNTALAGQESLEYLVTTFPEKFNETKIYELADRLIIQDTFGKKGDQTPFGKRHPPKVEDIISKWASAAGNKAKALKGKRDSEDITFIKDFQLKQENHNKWKKDGVDNEGNKYTKTDEQFRLEQLKQTIN